MNRWHDHDTKKLNKDKTTHEIGRESWAGLECKVGVLEEAHHCQDKKELFVAW